MDGGLTIMSGGQTGVDRGALDAALSRGVRCGGWCPDGRLAEDGTIPAIYPLTPLPGGKYRERTLRNVLDSDGTAILHFGPLSGGTALTREFCLAHGKPHLLIDGTRLRPAAAGERIASFARGLPRGLLNVAGPRASQAAGARGYAAEAVGAALDALGEGHGAACGGPGSGARTQWPGAAPSPGAAAATVTGGDTMDMRLCHSCAAPLDVPGFAGPAEQFCRFCSDESGKLRRKKEVRDGIARWMQGWQPELEDKEARKRAKRYMSAMPAWAD